MKALRLAFVALAALSLGACVTTQTPKDYAHFRAVDPHSIVVVPAVNRSLEVTAADYYLSTITLPLAERGYYVFPVHLVKRVMEDDGLSDADLVHSAPPERLGEMFHADAILYVTIEKWDSTYAVFATSTEVTIAYALKDAHTGETLWDDTEALVYQPQANNSGGGLAGLIAQAVVAAMERAAPNYMPLARQANGMAVNGPGKGLPAGPYSPKYGADAEAFPSGVQQAKAETPAPAAAPSPAAATEKAAN
jgi:hypothetical protein